MKIKNDNDISMALEVKGLTKKYSRTKAPAVQDASFSVKEGHFHGFVGANGAGKTTIIKSLIGAYGRFEGEVSFFGHNYNSNEAKSLIGYVPESAHFPYGLSTISYLKWFGFLSGLSFKESKKRAWKLLKSIGLETLANKMPRNFSSGQKKSILLVQSLLHKPKILIMDEPAANLDPSARINFFNLLKKLQKQNITIFISSHILSELNKYIDSLTILDGGKIVFTGLIKQPNPSMDNQKFISSTTNTKLKKFLSREGFKPKKYKTGFIIDSKDESKNQSLLKLLLKEKVVVNEYKTFVHSIEDLYQKYVLLGSTHTHAIKKVGKNA